MIKLILVLFAVVVLSFAEDEYTTKYDNVNIDEILSNSRLYSKYLSCLLSDSDIKCTSDGKVLKETIPDALVTDCSKCSEKQKQNADKVIKYMIENKPDDYQKLEAIYDQDGVFRKQHGY